MLNEERARRKARGERIETAEQRSNRIQESRRPGQEQRASIAEFAELVSRGKV